MSTRRPVDVLPDRTVRVDGAAQAAIDAWVQGYNRRRPHQPLDMAYPADRSTRLLARFAQDDVRSSAAAELIRP
jgi:transposase InsO family protein